MKKEIKFPKGAKSIEFDLVSGVATAIYDSETVKEINKILKEETDLERLTKIAHEKGLKDEVVYKSINNLNFYELNEPFCVATNGSLMDDCGYTIYDKEKDLWAKPILFTNSLGTHFCKGDVVYYLIDGSEIPCSCTIENMPKQQMGGDDQYTESMTKKQYYQWLADHCKE